MLEVKCCRLLSLLMIVYSKCNFWLIENTAASLREFAQRTATGDKPALTLRPVGWGYYLDG